MLLRKCATAGQLLLGSIDRDYIRNWAQQLGATMLLDELLQRTTLLTKSPRSSWNVIAR